MKDNKQNTILFHGSEHIIKKPDYLKGNAHNDYGKGFYCTLENEMSKEWACKNGTDGFSNRYSFDLRGLNVLDLLDGKHSVLNWIALLLKYRTFRLDSEIAIDARDYIVQNFSVDLSPYDVVIGYRADDSYFSYAQSFVENTLPMRSLTKALALGKLGSQTVLVSEKTFENIMFLDAEPVDKSIYYPKFHQRDALARETYRKEIRTCRFYRDDLFVLDIIREEIKSDDPRIQRIIFN